MCCGVHTHVPLYQYGKGIKQGPDSDASSTHTRAPADGNESRSLAKRVKHHKHLQYPPLGMRKTLPSAMNSCLGLEPCHVLYTQLWSVLIPADNYPYKQVETKREKSKYLQTAALAGTVSPERPLSLVQLLDFPFQVPTQFFLCLIYRSSKYHRPPHTQ